MSVHALAYRPALDSAFPRDFIMVCIWSVCGLALTGLFCIAGPGVEIAQAWAAFG